MKVSRLCNLLLTAAPLVLSASAAQAGLLLDLRVTGGGKTATVSSLNDTINLSLYAVVQNPNGADANDAFQSAYASLLSSGSMLGDFVSGVAATPFDGASHQDTNNSDSTKIVPIDLDSDTDLDLGSNNDGSAAGFFFARANALQVGTEFLLGTFQWEAHSLDGIASLNVRGRTAATGAIWREGSSVLTPSTGTLAVGSPVVVSVPEPGAIGLATVAALEALRRRRKRQAR
jgi:MYXO-CTERM domain-containing protein